MSPNIHYTIHKNTFWLSADRCVFWEQENTLIISDLHFGKTGHFRKAGIPIPQNVFKEDLQCLFSLIQFYQPSKLIIVGDLFHSEENKELSLFLRWRNNVSHLNIHLIKGNHDVLNDNWYQNAGITISCQQSDFSNFNFMHDITNQPVSHVNGSHFNYTFSGHIHPGITIKSGSRQSMCFPCFYFGESYAVLPAFSKFTGLAMIHPKKNETVYAIVDKTLIKIF